MDHLDVERARAYLRDRLAPADRQHWRQHLAGCARCRELLESERNLMAVLRLGEAEPTAGPRPDLRALVDEVEHLVLTPEVEQRRRHRRLGLLGVCAALAVLLAWQVQALWRARDAARAAAAEHETEYVARHLPALLALEREPWLRDDYEFVTALETLFREARP
jgi:hypothetical protein